MHLLFSFLQLEKGVLNLYLIVSTLIMSYNHSNAFEWYTAWQKLKKSKPLQVVESPEKSKFSNKLLNRYCHVSILENDVLYVSTL